MISIRQIKSKEEFEEFLSYGGGKLHVLKISAPWCAPCRALGTTLKGLDAEKVKGALFAELSMEDEPTEALAEELMVRGVPVMIYFMNGEELKRTVGLVTADVIYKNASELNG